MRSALARATRDRMVPTGQPATSAASAYGRPSCWVRTEASWRSGSSRAGRSAAAAPSATGVPVGEPFPDAESLTFPVVQSYSDGNESAWIEPSVDGEAEPQHPAPVLALAGDPAAERAPPRRSSTSTPRPRQPRPASR